MSLHMNKMKIAKLQRDRLSLMMQTIVVILFAFFVVALLPQLLFKYMFADQQLTQEPPILGMIPTVAFAVATIYFLYAMIASMAKAGKIARLEKEMNSMAMNDGVCCTDCVGSCKCSEHGMCQCGNCDMPMMAEPKVMSAPRKKAAKK